jgi:hypothetical protein
MRNRLRAVLLLACFVILVASSVALAANNWLGTWKLDVAASKFSPGPAPKGETLKFEAAEGGIKLTSHIVDAQGKATFGNYVSKFDGQDVPWKGNPDADTASAKRIDDNSYENTWKKGGAVTITAEVVVSPDGKTLNITQTGKDSKGRAVDNALVFHRH